MCISRKENVDKSDETATHNNQTTSSTHCQKLRLQTNIGDTILLRPICYILWISMNPTFRWDMSSKWKSLLTIMAIFIYLSSSIFSVSCIRVFGNQIRVSVCSDLFSRGGWKRPGTAGKAFSTGLWKTWPPGVQSVN